MSNTTQSDGATVDAAVIDLGEGAALHLGLGARATPLGELDICLISMASPSPTISVTVPLGASRRHSGAGLFSS